MVMLVLDEFPSVALMNREGNIPKSRFPNFRRLSREAVWYPDNTTVAPHTQLAVPAMLTGDYPKSNLAFPVYSSYRQNLFTWMHSAGYRIAASEAATQLCPQAICPLPARKRLNPADYPDPVAFLNAKAYLNRFRARRGHLGWARQLRIRPGKLIYNHILLPHWPYEYLPSGQRYPWKQIPKISPAGNPEVTASEGQVRLSYQRLLLQVGYVDRVIGALRRSAIRQGRWRSMMLVVTGDHGSDHRPGGFWRQITRESAGSTAFTPLFIKYPGSLTGGTSPLATKGIDIFPTIAAETGAGQPRTDGTPVPALPHRPRPLRIDGQTLSFSAALASRSAAERYRERLLGSRGLFDLGASSGLIGRKARGAKPRMPLAVPDDPAGFARTGPGATVVPAMLTGTVSPRAGRFLAIAINGTVRATAEVFPERGSRRFGAMIAARFIRPGARIAIFQVSRGHLGRRLG